MNDTTTDSAARRPRVRFGTITWGLIVCATAVAMLLTIATPDSRDAFMTWVATLTPGALGIILVLAAGGLVLLLGVLALVRRAQRERGREHPPIG